MWSRFIGSTGITFARWTSSTERADVSGGGGRELFLYYGLICLRRKVKECCPVCLSTTPLRCIGGVDITFQGTFLTSVLWRCEWLACLPGLFNLGGRAPGTSWRADWVGLLSCSGRGDEKKNASPSGNRTAIVQPVVLTDWTTSGHTRFDLTGCADRVRKALV